jgi:hypothetical protein
MKFYIVEVETIKGSSQSLFPCIEEAIENYRHQKKRVYREQGEK